MPAARMHHNSAGQELTTLSSSLLKTAAGQMFRWVTWPSLTRMSPPRLLTPLTLLLLLPASRTEQQQEGSRYHMSPSGTYHLASSPRIIYKPGRDVCVVEEVPTLSITFPGAWTQGTYCSHPTSLDSRTWSELGRAVEVDEGWSGPPLLLYHLLPRRWLTTHLHHGQNIPTLYQGHPITVTKLENKMVLLNCVGVVRVDVHSRDGVVHVISRPLPPAYTLTLADLISSDHKLTLFYTLLGYGELVSLVRHTGPLTVLAPTNDAFNRLPRHFLDSITYDAKYFPALQALVRQHLLEGLQCSTALRRKAEVTTMEGRSLTVSCNHSLTLRVGASTVTTPDLLTSNGVLHYVDRVLIPPMALSLAQVTRRAGATTYIRLVRRVGLFHRLVSYGPYTVFAPSNKALRRLKRTTLQDHVALKKLVLYHLADGAHASYTLRDNHLLPSRLPGASLRVKIHPKVMSVEDGVVMSSDHVAFNGYVHVLDQVLTPPTHTLARTLALTPTLSRFTALITQAGVWAWKELSLGKGPYTLLAVKDQDIDTWATDTFTYYRLINDRNLLNQSLNIHLLEDLVMPRALQEGTTFLLGTRHAPRALRLSVSGGRLSLHHASVSSDYILCTNGIILFIDSLLLP
ncbi:periostin isoform X2 [Cherax quadricarinatus]|uniref:periostin isoform X2 n=1 Tax=Cherax quadricarinatus TaxID=27406 RepID=UPI00387E9BC8